MRFPTLKASVMAVSSGVLMALLGWWYLLPGGALCLFVALHSWTLSHKEAAVYLAFWPYVFVRVLVDRIKPNGLGWPRW